MKDEIKEIFQSKLQNHESAVNPSVWQGIQQQMGFSSASSTAGTAKGFLATTTTKIVASVAVLAAVGTASYYSFRVDPSAPSQQTTKSEVQVHESAVEQPTNNTIAEYNPSETNQPQNTIEQNTNNLISEEKPIETQSQELTNEAASTSNTTSNSSSIEAESNESSNEVVASNHIEEVNAEEMGPTQTTPQPENTIQQASNEYSTNSQSSETTVAENTVSTQTELEAVIISDIPKVFTPNNDGKNDVFPIEIKHAEKVDFVVLNTNSQVVFRSESADIKWNGKDLAGNEVEAGSYIYVLKIIDKTNQVISKKGLITLIK